MNLRDTAITVVFVLAVASYLNLPMGLISKLGISALTGSVFTLLAEGLVRSVEHLFDSLGKHIFRKILFVVDVGGKRFSISLFLILTWIAEQWLFA